MSALTWLTHPSATLIMRSNFFPGLFAQVEVVYFIFELWEKYLRKELTAKNGKDEAWVLPSSILDHMMHPRCIHVNIEMNSEYPVQV